MKSKKKTPYLTSAQLAEALEESQKLGRPTVKVCEYFKLIAQHLLGDSRYRNYPNDLHEDMVSAALEKCIRNIKNYKAEYADRCFNYYTRCSEHAVWTVLKKHYRAMNTTRKMALDFADKIERFSPQLAKSIREDQITVEHTKDKITFKSERSA